MKLYNPFKLANDLYCDPILYYSLMLVIVLLGLALVFAFGKQLAILFVLVPIAAIARVAYAVFKGK